MRSQKVCRKVSWLAGVAAGLVSWLMSSLALGTPPVESREDIVCRARTGVGFSYYYGEGCWCGKGGCQPDINEDCPKGTCTGDCSTKCTHSNGKYGADCSGYVAKVWQVPNPVDLGKCNFHPYGARDFRTARDYWTVTSDLSSLEPGDAAAKNGHVLLIVEKKNSAGKHKVAEASGCKVGIIEHLRALKTEFNGATRTNLTSCACTAGQREEEACECGKRERTCEDGCNWSAWSACSGPDPNTPCTLDEPQGACRSGLMKCVAGKLTCELVAGAEVCDGVDNDCDGVVDNGTPQSMGTGRSCDTACGQGTTHCAEGRLHCIPPGKTWPNITCDGAGGSGGNADSGSDAKGGGKGEPDLEENGNYDSGCGCLIAGEPVSKSSMWWLLLAVPAWQIATRRRVPSRSARS